uniref:Uncharacterized protein n=1 Tax=Ciona intestinalis TaxID=7719 RepID=H2XKB0_CIOIN
MRMVKIIMGLISGRKFHAKLFTRSVKMFFGASKMIPAFVQDFNVISNLFITHGGRLNWLKILVIDPGNLSAPGTAHGRDIDCVAMTFRTSWICCCRPHKPKVTTQTHPVPS